MSAYPEIDFSQLNVGDEIGTLTFAATRDKLVRYAGASGDFNPIHWNERFATEVGLPNVIAHGMLTMAVAGEVVANWCGDPGAIVEYGVRFTKPVIVPDDTEGGTIEVSGKIASLDADNQRVRIDLQATSAGVRVLGKAFATVQL